jgi:hypothetical protein
MSRPFSQQRRGALSRWEKISSWSKDLAVEIAGRDVINHAGAATLRLIADRTGLDFSPG